MSSAKQKSWEGDFRRRRKCGNIAKEILIMQTNIIWTGRLYQSIENCILTRMSGGNEIVSTIIGHHENRIYKIDYHICTNENWETTFVNIRTQFDNLVELITLEKKEGKWLLNNKPDPEFEDIFDIDISLTPFTNTLPVNRLKLKDGERKVIEVIYFDIFEKEIKSVKQVYTRVSGTDYVYENYDGSFKANIRVDEQGLVVDYSELFEMITKHESNYSATSIKNWRVH
jgi:uncharacterized protein